MESYVFSFDLLSVSTGYIIVPGFEGNTSTLSQKYCGPKLKDSLWIFVLKIEEWCQWWMILKRKEVLKWKNLKS